MTAPRPALGARRYMPQLDGLRFFAVTAVLVHHNWRPQEPWPFDRLDWGSLGVRLFFVLSGFLITGILLGGRDAAEAGRPPRIAFLRSFYARRFLRIVPVYYLALLIIVANGAQPARDLPWLFTFTTNIHIWRQLEWIDFPHFWTLAVEEQFYLVWPLLVLFLARRRLTPVLLAIIALGPLYRLFATFRYPADTGPDGSGASLIFPLGVVDSLAIGALLAIAFGADPEGLVTRRVLTRLVLPAGIVLFALTHTELVLGRQGAIMLRDTASALVFCWLVGIASQGFRGFLGRILEWQPVVYLGKISYGIYIFHLLVPYLLFLPLAEAAGRSYENSGFVNFLASFAVTVAVASASWHLFEAPINRLKRFFPYGRASAEAVVPPPAPRDGT